MSDIVERLDGLYNNEMQWENVWEIAEDASAEITRLRERLAEADECNRRVSDENEKLREALKPFADEAKVSPMPGEPNDPRLCSFKFLQDAADALKE